ncbi:carbohydrate ABC transporter membrane protein 1 (CUT1 family) [Saccharothrix carnea]|uniref:Carbohydrate ABC transporter membrane protein 1 (CUT1 family) n=1 Tax=Saccharothrix carnea TaxID=1280637 RepID=A0A2P8I0P0_SACCR|nr:sugar ABC transporter permease [Saccharothrix carnea]PSL52025.1 carbohydrate ABC transporter membrane protein 1 (CUT1 family) [Saccharothrix carnea]
MRWRRVGWLFVLPALAVYAVFVLRPLALTAQYSLYRWDGVGPSTWVGLANYREVLTDPDLYGAIGHALVLVVFFTGLPVPLGLLAAAVIRRTATRPVRAVLLLPQAVPLVAAGIAWSLLLSSTGAVNRLLDVVGLGGAARAWFGDSSTALAAVGVVGAWVLLGLCTTLLLVGAERIDPALYEAARLDGAGPWAEFRAVTLPGVRRELWVCVAVTAIAALASFDIVYVTTRGGPGDATSVPGFEVFSLAFAQREVGLASALAVVLVVPALAAVAPALRWSR